MNGSILGTALFSFDTPNRKGLLDGFSFENIKLYRDQINRINTLLAQIETDDLTFSAFFAAYAVEALSLHKNKSDSTDFLSLTDNILKKYDDLWHQNYRHGVYNFSKSFLTEAADFLQIETGDKNEQFSIWHRSFRTENRAHK